MSGPAARIARLLIAPAEAGPPVATAVPPSAGLLAADRDLLAAAGALAATLRARAGAPAVVVCAWRPDCGRPAVPAPFGLPAAGRAAARLSARGFAARAAGRVCVVDLPDAPAQAAAHARRAHAATELPFVLACARRAPETDAILAGLDELALGVPAAGAGDLERLALEDLGRIGPRAAPLPVPVGPARLLAHLGVAAAAGAARSPWLREVAG